MTERPIKLLIVVASGRGWASRFGGSFGTMMLNLGWARLPGKDGVPRLQRCATSIHHGAYLVEARNRHVIEALKGDYTHMLSLDDDMMFPHDVVERMLAHDKPVVTANYRKKLPDRLEFVCHGPDGQMVSSFKKTGIERVVGMGMGLTLIDLDAIRDIPAPYFAVIWNEGTGEMVIEDAVFCALLGAHGVEIWCDHDLSQDVGHVGDFEFRVPTPRPLELFPTLEKSHETQKIAAGLR